MSAGRRRVLLALWSVLVFGLAVRSLALGLGVGDADPVHVRSVLVDVNRASVGELMALPGIGAVRAEAIVLDRIRNGPFRTVQDLDRVDGLGPDTCAGLRPFVHVTGPAGAGTGMR